MPKSLYVLQIQVIREFANDKEAAAWGNKTGQELSTHVVDSAGVVEFGRMAKGMAETPAKPKVIDISSHAAHGTRKNTRGGFGEPNPA